MPTKAKASALDTTFHIGLALKGLNAALELIGGALVLILPQSTFQHVVDTLNRYQLSEGSLKTAVSHFQEAVHHFSGSTKLFGAAYLLSHGIVKLVLVIALFKDRLWAYPWMIVVLVGFIVYQLYLMTNHLSIGLIVLTIFDALILVLTWLEYRKHRKSVISKPA